MTTASDIIDDALELMGVSTALSPPDPHQQSRGFKVLKGMIAEWIADEIDIIIVEPYDSTDDIGEDSELTQTIIALLCKRLSGYLQTELTGDTEKMCEVAMDRLLKYAPDPDIEWPDTLPIGQGNKQYAPYRASPYFDAEKN